MLCGSDVRLRSGNREVLAFNGALLSVENFISKAARKLTKITESVERRRGIVSYRALWQPAPIYTEERRLQTILLVYEASMHAKSSNNQVIVTGATKC